jgi:predicted LPLAT superfamily acyltransferase
VSTDTSAHSPPDAARPRWAVKAERGSALALRMLIRVVRALGPRTSRLLVHPIAAYFLLTDREARRASRAYFARLASLPEGRAALGHEPGIGDIYRHLLEFSISIFDRICVWAGETHGFELVHRGTGHFAHLPDVSGPEANALGKCGTLIASAHLGTFDMMRVVSLAEGVPVRAVMYSANAETINAFFSALNPGLGRELIHIRPGHVSATFEIRSAVEHGSFVVIMGDRVGIDGGATHTVRFLGAPARFPEGPFALAALMGCPLMVATSVRIGPFRYRVDSEPLYEGGRVPRRDRAKVVHEMIERYAAYLERACLAKPHQWFNFFDFWDPGGG